MRPLVEGSTLQRSISRIFGAGDQLLCGELRRKFGQKTSAKSYASNVMRVIPNPKRAKVNPKRAKVNSCLALNFVDVWRDGQVGREARQEGGRERRPERQAGERRKGSRGPSRGKTGGWGGPRGARAAQGAQGRPSRGGSGAVLAWGPWVLSPDQYWSPREPAPVPGPSWVPPTSGLQEAGKRPGSTFAIAVEGLKRRPRSVGGRPRP